MQILLAEDLEDTRELMLVVTVAVLTNLAVDLLYVWLDPRIRLN